MSSSTLCKSCLVAHQHWWLSLSNAELVPNCVWAIKTLHNWLSFSFSIWEILLPTLHIMYLICTVVYINKLIVVLFQMRKPFSCFFKANMMTHRVLFRDICHNFFWGDITYMCGAKYDPIFLKDEIPVILSDKSTNRIIFCGFHI